MTLNLYQERVRNQMVNDIKKLKSMAQQARTDQTLVLTYGTITLDGNAGAITIDDGSNNDIIVMDDTGVSIKDTSGNTITTLNTSGLTIKAISDAVSIYSRFQTSASVNVGAFAFQRYTYGGYEVSDFVTRTYLSSVNQKVGYVTLDIYKSDLTTRSLFFQISETYNSSGVFTEAVLNFAKDEASPSFAITISNTSGNGYMDIPKSSSDPTAVGGRMYYNTTTGKFRKCNGFVWSDV